ncbi:MAG TPA: helicase C-terminal domain-containing protein [Jiangellales bacterium]|nr:helicase C-terminal domain-containing protein [Jiangellales bacterium]
MGTVTTEPPRSLAADLRRRSDAELAALMRARPDLLTPLPADVAQLASRATTRTSVSRALDRLDRFALYVVEALAVLAEPAGPAAVGSLLAVPTGPVQRALERLRTQALVWGPEQSTRLVRTARETLGPYPGGLGPPLTRLLEHQSPARRAGLAADLGIAAATDAQQLAAEISGRISLLLDEISPDAVAALRALAAGPPAGRIDEAHRQVDRDTARTPVEELLARGLVLPIEDSTVVLPREVGLHMRGGVLRPGLQPDPPEPTGTERDADSVDRLGGAGAYDAVRRIESLLDSWAHDPPPVLRTGGLGVRDLRKLPRLLDVDDAAAALLVEIAHVAGLLGATTDADPVWLPSPRYDAWLRTEPAARWVELATAWLSTSRVAALVGGRDERDRLVPPLGNGLDRPPAAEIRRLVLDVLAALAPGTAPEPNDVLEAVRWRRPRRGGHLRDDLTRWTLREAELLGVTGHGALASYVRPLLDGRPAEAAHKAATAALAAVLPIPLDHVLVQADLTAIAPGPLQSDLARELAAMAEVESRGGATVHRFTPESIRRALDGGRTAEEIHEFLHRISRTPVPQPLTYLVDDVARRHGRLRVGAAMSYIRCDDHAVLAEIMADSRALALGLRRIAPTVLASSLEPTTLLERLRGIGLSPAAEGPDGAVVTAQAARRAPEQQRPAPLLADRPVPDDATLAAAVRAVRAGERSAAVRPPGPTPAGLGRSASAQTLAVIRRALDHGTPIWIGYVDHHGMTSERIVDPIRLDAGWLAAFDHRSGETRSFAVHRISGVADVDDEPAG